MKKVWKRLIAVSLSLMLMFTMGVNVFAADGDDVTEAAFDNSTTLADGEYSDAECTVTKESDGSVATVLSLQKIIVTDAKAVGVFKVDKNTKTHVYIGSDRLEEDLPELVDPNTGTCGSYVYPVDTEDSLEVTIPVKLNSDMHVAVRTKMKDYKWVNYNYHIQIFEPEWKPTQNQVKFPGIIYGKGMFSAAEKGTTLTVNPDATITLHVTTKPMISNKYVKVALSPDEINNENVEEIAATIPILTFSAIDLYTNRQNVELGPRQYYWSVFDYTVPLGMIDKKINVWAYNTLKQVDQENSIYEENELSAAWANWGTWTVMDTPELAKQIQEAYKNATSEEAKSAFEQALNNSEYNFSNNSIAVAAIPAKTYTGKALTPDVTVTAGEDTLVKGTDYTVTYANNINAGTAKVTVKGEGNYFGEKTATFKINKASNPLSVSGKNVKIKKKKVRKKAQKLAAGTVLNISNAQGTVTYKGVGVNKKSKKALKINAASGQITVKKKAKKGTYKMNVTVTAEGNGNYEAASKTSTVVIKVK